MLAPRDVVHSDPEILSGEPVFAGTRVPLRNLFEYLTAGDSLEGFLDAFPDVTREQAVAALEAAREAMTTQNAFACVLAALVATNQIADARALLRAVPADMTSDLGAWTTALAEPTAKPDAALPESISADLDWIRRHATHHAGRWVALRAGELLGSADALRELLAIVDRAGGRTGVLIQKL